MTLFVTDGAAGAGIGYSRKYISYARLNQGTLGLWGWSMAILILISQVGPGSVAEDVEQQGVPDRSRWLKEGEGIF